MREGEDQRYGLAADGGYRRDEKGCERKGLHLLSERLRLLMLIRERTRGFL